MAPPAAAGGTYKFPGRIARGLSALQIRPCRVTRFNADP